MKAVILAAGFARRMRPLSSTRHKTLLEINGRTIISRIVDGLLEEAVTDICVVTGYRADELEGYLLATYPDVRFSFVRNEDYARTNNIYSMALALDSLELDDDILLIESDLIFDSAVLKRAIKSEHENVALVDRYRTGMDGTVVAVSSTGVITQVIPSALQDERFNFSDKYKTLNIYKFSSDFCRTTFKRLLGFYARAIDDNCYYELILGILIYMQQVQIYAEVLDGELWAEVDDPNDLRAADFAFSPERRQELLSSSWGGYWNMPVTDFAFIRNMYFPTPGMLSELRAGLPDVVVNYGSTQALVAEKLSFFLLCDPRFLRVGNGASEFFPILRRWQRDGAVHLPSPTFGEYSRMFGTAVTYRDDFAVDFKSLGPVSPGDLVVFVNPNNPTGTTLETARILEFARKNPEAMVLVDESFIEFSDEPSIVIALEEELLDNVTVLKSLSKSLGVPGIRLGFLYSRNASLLEFVSEELPVWNVNSLAENYLEILLKHRPELERSFNQTRQDRQFFADSLEQLPIVETVLPSGANFLLARLAVSAEESDEAAALLLRERIYVKDVTSKFSDGSVYWRLAVRLPHENDVLCNALRAY